MLKYILMAVCGYILWKMIKGDWTFGKKKTPEPPARDPLVSKGEMVKDPVCGAFVSPSCGITLRQGSVEHCFCSPECRDEFQKRLAAEAGQDDKTS